MNAQSLALPQATTCPVRGRLMEQVHVEPIFGEETGELETVVVICPYCGVRHDFDVKTIARAVALEAIARLHDQT